MTGSLLSSAGSKAETTADSGSSRTVQETAARGSTHIPAHVVADIAAQAACEVPHVGADAGGVLGVGARRTFHARPSAQCQLYGRTAVLRLDIGVDFPTPLTAVVSSVRQHVCHRVKELTGVDVGRLDLEISWLRAEGPIRKVLR